ncbi:MAG: hypothetical protein OXU23_08440, partial [Candidatus Poribacteria bacterium]|nr:hypothetical protein [Candidatus Poribacteria bacterium]
ITLGHLPYLFNHILAKVLTVKPPISINDVAINKNSGSKALTLSKVDRNDCFWSTHSQYGRIIIATIHIAICIHSFMISLAFPLSSFAIYLGVHF